LGYWSNQVPQQFPAPYPYHFGLDASPLLTRNPSLPPPVLPTGFLVQPFPFVDHEGKSHVRRCGLCKYYGCPGSGGRIYCIMPEELRLPETSKRRRIGG
jgi:hypothetical protein